MWCDEMSVLNDILHNRTTEIWIATWIGNKNKKAKSAILIQRTSKFDGKSMYLKWFYLTYSSVAV